MNPMPDPMHDHILLVEDDPRLAEMLTEYLSQAAFRVTHAPNGRAALEHITAGDIDAVILDLMLPDMDGLDVCRQLRAISDIPVLMLTARGADDYLPKPFEPRELLARLRAILRRRVEHRHQPDGAARRDAEFLRFGRLEIDPAAHAAR